MFEWMFISAIRRCWWKRNLGQSWWNIWRIWECWCQWPKLWLRKWGIEMIFKFLHLNIKCSNYLFSFPRLCIDLTLVYFHAMCMMFFTFVLKLKDFETQLKDWSLSLLNVQEFVMEHVTPELHCDEFQKQMEPLLQVSFITCASACSWDYFCIGSYGQNNLVIFEKYKYLHISHVDFFLRVLKYSLSWFQFCPISFYLSLRMSLIYW